MMGDSPNQQGQFFYNFNLDDYIPQDHQLRQIDKLLDLSSLREHLAPYYSHTGRPSIDPELMVRMLLIGYCYGIRSERRLCEEVQLNLAYRWFCRLSIEDKVPEHSTFSKNRHGRFRDSDVFRHVFEQVLQRGMAAGLVGGEGFAVDASIVEADVNRRRHQEDDDDWGSGGGSRAVREYLQGLEEQDTPVGKSAKRISPTDPGARYTSAMRAPAIYAYSTNYLVDVRAGMIVDVEATPSYRPAEVASTKTMIDRVETRFALKPKRLIGDTAYGTADILGWMVEEKRIEPHVPLWEKGERDDGTFSRSDFCYDPTQDQYTCPEGKLLRRRQRHYRQRRTGNDDTIRYLARKADCNNCALKQRCCPNTPSRKVPRSVHESARDVARQVNQTPAYLQSRKDRKKVEMLFGHLKRILKLNRLRLRGLTGARDEFILAATAQNLRRMVKYLAQAPPMLATGVSS